MSDIATLRRIEKLMKLFQGSEFAHGIYIEEKQLDPLKPKVKGKADLSSISRTVKERLSNL